MRAEYLGWKIFENWSLPPDSYELKVVFATCVWNAALIIILSFVTVVCRISSISSSWNTPSSPFRIL